jgi:hypothetical protein
MNQTIHKNPLVDAVKDATHPRAQEDLDATAEPDGQFPRPSDAPEDEGHEGATEEQVGDRTGPGVGYDQEEKSEP